MKKITFLLISVLWAGILFCQQQKVAVYVTGEQDAAGINKILGDQLVAAFTNRGKYIAVERTSSFLAALGKEHAHERTGAVSNQEIARLGKQFGVQLVCVAEVIDALEEKYVTARLIDVETAEIQNSANGTSKLSNMNDLLSLSDLLVTKLNSETAEEKANRLAIQRAERELLFEKAKADTTLCVTTDGLVIDLRHPVSNNQISYTQAEALCSQSKHGGLGKWRLPTETEMISFGAGTGMPNGISYRHWTGNYWTNTPANGDGSAGFHRVYNVKDKKVYDTYSLVKKDKGTGPFIDIDWKGNHGENYAFYYKKGDIYTLSYYYRYAFVRCVCELDR